MTWRFARLRPGAGARGGAGRFDALGRRRGASPGLGGGDRRTPLWLTGAARGPARRPTRWCWSHGSAADADRLARAGGGRGPGRAARCCPAGRAGWSSRCRAPQAALDAMLAAEPGTYADIAAVSTSVDGTLDRRRRRRTSSSTPSSTATSDPVGEQVVMTHEATHIATGAPMTSGVPLWLLEGFADYVALRDVDLPLSTTAGQIIAQVRARRGAGRTCPGRPSSTRPPPTWVRRTRAAWLACLVRRRRWRARTPWCGSTSDVARGGRHRRPRCARAFGLDEARADPALAGSGSQTSSATTHGRRVTRAAHGPWRSARRRCRRLRGARRAAGAVGPGPRRAAARRRPGGVLHRRRRSQRGEDFARWARVWSWSSLAVSLRRGVACSASPGLGRALVARLPRPLVGPGAARGGRARGASAACVTLPFAVAAAPARPRLRPVATRPGAAYAVDLLKSEAVDVVVTSLVAARARRVRPALAARLAGRGRRRAGRAGAARLVRLPAGGRADVQLLHVAARTAPLRTQILALADARGRARRRRAGGRRVAAYDDAERLRLRLRQHPAGRGLRQPRRRPGRRRDALGRGPRARARQARRRARRDRLSVPPGRCSASGCWRCCCCGAASEARRGSPTRGACPGSWRWSRVATLLASPVQNGISRQIETRADVDALRGDRRPGGVHRAAAAAGAAVRRRPHAAGVVAALVRLAPDDPAADRASRASGRREPATAR